MSYAEDAADALQMIEEDGRPLKIVKDNAGTFDETTNVITPGAKEETDTTGVEVSYESDDIDGTKIQQGDKKFLIPAIAKTPTTSHKVIDGEEVFNIVKVNPLKPGDTVIFYELQVRQ